jgi:iron complex outermembrane receptor protein
MGDEAVWESVNHTKVNSIGVEASLYFDFLTMLPEQRFLRNINLAYSYIDQDKDLESYMQSQYALEYLKHKFTAQADFNLYSHLFLNLSYRLQERKGNYQLLSGEVKPYGAYSLLDARLSWNADKYKLYVEANNLFDKTYYDYGNVPQPGRWIMAGASYSF